MLSSPVYLAMTAVAMVFAIMWTTTNFYNYYPLVQSGLLTAATRVRTKDEVFVRRMIDDPAQLPRIDVLIPAYQEPNVIHQSIRSVSESAYPNEKISLHAILEPDDVETKRAVESLTDEYSCNLITVPESYPGIPNKPRALDYAFEVTDAPIVGIIDAENIVSDQLLDRVAGAFADPDVDFLQGMVDMVNEDDGWLNILFRAEYGFWYRLIVPAFHRLGFPIPLSGTTCFFRRSVLERASQLRYDRSGSPFTDTERRTLDRLSLEGLVPWDLTNVTEDFELGLLLWAYDYDLALIDVITYEESPRTVSNWLKQRTRWQKGKLYTFVDFLRTPVRSNGRMSHLLWQSFQPHLGPMNLVAIVTLIMIGWIIGFVPELILVVSVLVLSMVFLLVGVASYVAGYWIASTNPAGTRLGRTIIVALTVPIYWLLQWVADSKAIKKLLTGDLQWERTIHLDHARFDEIRGIEERGTAGLRTLLESFLTRHFWIFPVLAIAAIVRLPTLGRSMASGEIYTVQVRGSMNTVGIILADEMHPPLYYLLVNAWTSVFGNSALAVRSLSVVIGLGVVLAGYWFATELYDRQTGLLTALFASLSVLQVQYAQTARMYSLFVLLTFCSLYFYVRVLRADSIDNRFGYGLCTVLMVLTHSYGWFVVAAQLVHFVLQYESFDLAAVSDRWVKEPAPVYVFVLPWVLFAIAAGFFTGTNVEGTATPDLQLVRDIFLSYANVPTSYPKIAITDFTLSVGLVILLGFFLSLVAMVYVGDRSADDLGVRWLLMLVLVSVVIGPFVLSFAFDPMIAVRSAIVGFVPFSVILARGIVMIDRETVKLIVTLILVGLAIANLTMYYQAPDRENWQELGETLDGADLSEDLIVFVGDQAESGTLYYLSEEQEAESTTVTFEDGDQLNETLAAESFERVWIVADDSAERAIAEDALGEENYVEQTATQFGTDDEPLELVEYHAEGAQIASTFTPSVQTSPMDHHSDPTAVTPGESIQEPAVHGWTPQTESLAVRSPDPQTSTYSVAVIFTIGPDGPPSIVEQ